MFIQGRLWQDTGGSPPSGGPRRGGWSLTYCVSISSHHPSHPIPQEPAAPCPRVSALTPLFPGETASWPVPFSPHPGGGSQDQPGPLPCNCSPLWARPKGRCSVQVESKEVSAHHIIAIHAVSGILHRVVDFSTECWQVLGEPVSVFCQKIPLYAFHQVFETQMHSLLLLRWLAVHDTVP